MTRLPSLRPKVVINGLQRGGFTDIRVRGSHYQLRHPGNGRRVTVPFHNRDLTRATLTSIIRQSGLTVEDFLKLL
jgi:predicted RNA binding protein YcfA (HicA-like mRNA interferase family)